MTHQRPGVSFVVPVRNGAPWIRATLESIAAQADGRPIEIIVVDDGSVDGSRQAVGELTGRADWPVPVRVLRRDGGGAAAAINAGARAATYPLIAQVDQDLSLQSGWLARLAAELDDPSIGAAQGYYATDPEAPLFARVMGLDLEARYAAIDGETDHICTGNSIYRAEALRRVGFFDETLGYGYDNDMSYRLRDAGYRLALCREARSFHRWRESLAGYVVQQYGFGYGRLDLVAKHRHRYAGDRVSPLPMMLHPILLSLALAALTPPLTAAGFGIGIPADVSLLAACGVIGAALISVLALERLWVGVGAARRFGDRAAWLFPVVHLIRDAAWVAAIAVWIARRACGRSVRPAHSMRPRSAGEPAVCHPALSQPRIIALIPAHNEAAHIAAVVAEVTRCRPDLEVLVLDDGSTDSTAAVIDRFGIRSLRFAERMGIGSAMRAGLRYAVRLRFDVAVRLDGDGQHDPADIDALLAPIVNGAADVVLGTRYASARGGHAAGIRDQRPIGLLRRSLATCLSALTGRRVTDPTSGFCAFAPSAVRLLAEHHPTGYAEPELRLFLSRNGLRVVEVPVRGRARLSGRTSLTPSRVVVAGARVLLAMVIVPLRAAIKEPRA